MVAMMNGDRKAIEDRVVKDVIMSGFQADNSTCCEAKLRFMLQQKTQLNDQWRYSRHELLRFLSQSLDKMSRSDIESLVQVPDEEHDFAVGLNGRLCDLEEEDEESSLDDDVAETETTETTLEPLATSPTQSASDVPTPANTLPKQANRGSSPKGATAAHLLLLQHTRSATNVVPPEPAVSSRQVPPPSPLASPAGNEQMQRLNQRIAHLESYVQQELAAIKREMTQMNVT